VSKLIEEARVELNAAEASLKTVLRAWDESVAELWHTSLALTQAQKRVTRAHELLRTALDTEKAPALQDDPDRTT
jgi:exonuclease VII small subunit